MRHFIFGYGSLICPLSRAVTAPSLKDAIAEPTVISHIERTWSARVSKCQVQQQARQQQRRQHHHSNDDDDDSVRDNNNDNGGDVCDDDDDDTMMIRGWTPMGVRFRRGAECNGVLIRVDDAELSRFDAREVGYLRRRIDLADVHPHVDDDDDDDDYAMEEGGTGGGGGGGEGQPLPSDFEGASKPPPPTTAPSPIHMPACSPSPDSGCRPRAPPAPHLPRRLRPSRTSGARNAGGCSRWRERSGGGGRGRRRRRRRLPRGSGTTLRYGSTSKGRGECGWLVGWLAGWGGSRWWRLLLFGLP